MRGEGEGGEEGRGRCKGERGKRKQSLNVKEGRKEGRREGNRREE